ncbi:prepilin peptidase [Treponema primitia]|uniref:prepilin peptidase n=1 Tax=Treponema primitia TaxID=88058 RepID=UPI00025555BB|nr:A24 family peptidase [Treponema primitia]
MTIPVFLLFLIFALPISWIDFRTYRIPDKLIFPGLLAIFILLLIVEINSLPHRVIAAFLSFFFFLITRSITKGLGLGDVKFAFLIGLCCGLPWTCIAFLGAALSGILAVLFLRRGDKETLRRPIPFAPFLTLGVIEAYTVSIFFHFFPAY